MKVLNATGSTCVVILEEICRNEFAQHFHLPQIFDRYGWVMQFPVTTIGPCMILFESVIFRFWVVKMIIVLLIIFFINFP